MGHGHVPLSARQLAGRAQIRDVQLLGNVVRVDEQVIVVIVAIPVLVCTIAALRPSRLVCLLGSLLLLELSAFCAREFRLLCHGRQALLFLFLFLLFFIFIFIVVGIVGIVVTVGTGKKCLFRVAKGGMRAYAAYRLSALTAVPFASRTRFRLDYHFKDLGPIETLDGTDLKDLPPPRFVLNFPNRLKRYQACIP
jgi:hypothetical protein